MKSPDMTIPIKKNTQGLIEIQTKMLKYLKFLSKSIANLFQDRNQ